MGEQQQFSLSWSNFSTTVLSSMNDLKDEETFVDVTLACDGQLISAHKSNPCQHPVIFMKDVSAHDLNAILTFMYKGEVHVSQQDLPSLLQTAQALKIRGLAQEAPLAEVMPAIWKELLTNKQENKDKTLLKTENTFLYDEQFESQNSVHSDFDSKRFKSDLNTAEHTDNQIKDELCGWPNDNGNCSDNQTESITNVMSNPLQIPDATSYDLPSRHKCQGCHKTFPNRAKLIHHVEAKHLPDKPGYVCNLCGKTAPTRNAVYIHRSRYHSSWKKHPFPPVIDAT